MTELHFQSATALAKAIREKTVGARELLEHFLARVDRFNPQINAVVVDIRDRARQRADEADAAIKRGDQVGPLHGVPMTIKESYSLTGTPATWGVPELKDNVAAEDALAVQRMNAAGVNIFGKSNVPRMLADWQSYNDIYGTTNNPWDLTRSPGGSSGGSAAALAAGLTGLEMGTDIGGSLRNPAHFCGVYAHKPTWNLCPPRGHSPSGALTPPDLSVIGPMGRSASDLRAALTQMAGPDLLEEGAVAVQLEGLTKPLSHLRVALWTSDPQSVPSRAVISAVEAVGAALATEGAQVDAQARPAFSTEESHAIFSGLLFSAMANRQPKAAYDELLARAAALKVGDDSPGAQVLRWQTLSGRDWAALNERRTRLRWAWREFFQSCDVLIAPIGPVSAFPHDHGPEGKRTLQVDGKTVPYGAPQLFWAGLSGVAYLPSTAIPCGPGADGLPVGVQLIGAPYSDLKLIDLAERLEKMGFSFRPPPNFG